MNNQSIPNNLPPPIAPNLQPTSMYETKNEVPHAKLDQLTAQGYTRGQS